MLQVSLGPVDCALWAGDGDGLREAVQALPPTVASLALLPDLSAEREGGEAGGAWRLQLAHHDRTGWPKGVPSALELCAAFDRSGLPSGLEGEVRFYVKPPSDATPEALRAYPGQCAELACRVRGSGARGLSLNVEVVDTAEGAEVAGGGVRGGFLDRVLSAVLPAAAPHVRRLELLLQSGFFPLYFISRHLVAPGVAFPLLETLVMKSTSDYIGSIAARDVAALGRLAAPRLVSVELMTLGFRNTVDGAIRGQDPIGAVTALAMGLARPVDATGRPVDLGVRVGADGHGSGGAEEGVRSVLAAAGRGWVRVALPGVCAPPVAN